MLINPVDQHQRESGLTQTEYAIFLGFKCLNTYFYHRQHLTDLLLNRIKNKFNLDLTSQAEQFKADQFREVVRKAKQASLLSGKGGQDESLS